MKIKEGGRKRPSFTTTLGHQKQDQPGHSNQHLALPAIGTVGNINGTNTSTVWRRYFGSSHAGGLNSVRGDGSVQFAPFTVDPIVWMNICVIDDGNVVNEITVDEETKHFANIALQRMISMTEKNV